ncbi:MAG TPA: hypothetical protein VFA70_06635 [Dehalococcoidia bacterium]|nr:hypothetical protein [Dehalococcoidia bacterium]
MSRDATRILDRFETLPISVSAPPGLHHQALRLAETYGIGMFGTHYIALAREPGCDLSVAGEHLLRALAGRTPFVRWIGDYPPP